jgi:tripartite-type tricarboxylate transporter receptor subunit TctC
MTGMRLLALLAGALVTAAVAGQAAAQAFPSRPVRVIVPLAAGGTGDTLARVVSEEMARLLGQPFIVENRPGSGGVIGTAEVARSAADGHTLISASPSHVINPALRAKAGYDAVKDFAPITVIANTHQLLVAHPSLPANTVRELIAYAKRNPGRLNYGSAGSGSATHLNGELFKSMAGVFIVHIPYRGSTQARQDLLAGEVQLAVDGLLPTLPLIRAGKLKALALTSSRRSSIAPEIPTLAEAGAPGYASDTWYGLLAPAGTPKEVISALHAAALKAIALPQVRDRLSAQGAELVGNTPEEFRALIERERTLWTKLVRDTGATVD